MSALRDLSFLQLSQRLPSNALVLGAAGSLDGKLCIDIAALTGDAIDELSDTGVVEFVAKLLDAAERAQTAANVNLPVGDRLNAFPTSNFSTPLRAEDGVIYSQRIQQVVSRARIDVDTVVGSVI